jgi:hypothetical protein
LTKHIGHGKIAVIRDIGEIVGVHLKEKPLSFRRKNKHELNQLLKDLKDEGAKALARMVALAESSKDEKIKLNTDKAIVEMLIEVADIINKDDTTRTLGEFKYNKDGPRELEEDDTPQIDFNEIQDV